MNQRRERNDDNEVAMAVTVPGSSDEGVGPVVEEMDGPVLDTSTSTTSSSQTGLFQTLEAGGRFRRDTRLGGILHRGKVSLREVSANDSLHVIVDGNRISAHIDQVCPLDCAAEDRTRYSLARVVAHNLSDVVTGLARRLRGLHRHHHCHLECEVVWVDDEDEPVLECAPLPR